MVVCRIIVDAALLPTRFVLFVVVWFAKLILVVVVVFYAFLLCCLCRCVELYFSFIYLFFACFLMHV